LTDAPDLLLRSHRGNGADDRSQGEIIRVCPIDHMANNTQGVNMIKLLSKSALLITIVAALYLLLTGNLFALNLLLVVQLLALALMPWARRSFQPGQFNIDAQPREGQMLVTGPYRYIRHPMYAGALLIIWAGIAGHLSALNVVVGVCVTAVIAIRIMVEEQYLRSAYPQYAQHASKTKRLIPYII
jgi:protein-S-isoprenylcysteine O-methyltransferase Ste14